MNKYKKSTDIQNQSPKTPFLSVDLNKVKNAYNRLHDQLKNVEIYYAMKCNPDPEIMKIVLACGGQFEISSANEMLKAISVGAKPEHILFSNPVKSLNDIKNTFERGVRCFSFDSICEVDKLAVGAPGSNVYVRLSIPNGKSVVASEGKFGISIDDAYKLIHYAKSKGLNPYGISFHVGSQMLGFKAWGHAIEYCSKLINMLENDDIFLEFLDIGGGFPVKYRDVLDDNIEIAASEIRKSLDMFIPKRIRVVAEPGRYLVANSGIMTSTVIGIAERHGKKWLHLDIGAFNGFMEALETSNNLNFPVLDSKKSNKKSLYNITGPTCDSQDTIMLNVPISSNIEMGDRIFIECAGAYTTTYTNDFNGFTSPETYYN